MDVASQPRLPPEIERAVFELALDQAKKNQYEPLLLVAKRVHIWLIPIVYKVCIVASDCQHWWLGFERHGHHVQGLLLNHYTLSSPTQVRNVVSLCPNITNFGWWKYPTDEQGRVAAVKSILSLAHLKKLSINAEFLIDYRDRTTAKSFEESVSNITHYKMFGTVYDCDFLRHFTSLTHLTIPYQARFSVQQILQELPSLQVLLCCASGSCLFSDAIDDERWVLLPYQEDVVKDWEVGARGGRDMWKIAGKMVEKRRRKGLENRVTGCS